MKWVCPLVAILYLFLVFHCLDPFYMSFLMLQVGDKVQKGQVLCIVEAMKLMNEIEVSSLKSPLTKLLSTNGELSNIYRFSFFNSETCNVLSAV